MPKVAVIGRADFAADPLACRQKLNSSTLPTTLSEQRHKQRIAGDRAALPGLAFTRPPTPASFVAPLGLAFHSSRSHRDQAVGGKSLAVHPVQSTSVE